MRTALIVLALVLPAFAGCLDDGSETRPASQAVAAASAAEAGARTGEAPAAPKEAYAVKPTADATTTTVAYPASLASNAAREPVTVDLSGEFSPVDCAPVGIGAGVQQKFRWHDLRENLEVGDVFAYNITFSYQNPRPAFAEIHPVFGIGSTVRVHNEPHQELTDVLVTYEGQGYWADDNDMAWVAVNCWWGTSVEPVPYALTVTFSFAEGAIPAEAPILVPVPENATQMFVRGVAVDATKGVLSHFRVFDADDALVCECQLSSNQEVATLPLTGGEYVLLVDHTANGFVSVAFDAPPAAPLTPLDVEWMQYPLHVDEGTANVAETLVVDIPTVPLLVTAAARPYGDSAVGAGKKTEVLVQNARGEVLHQAWGGHLAFEIPNFGQAWWGIWPMDWAYSVDHHAFDAGEHQVEVKAEAFRGEIYLLTRQYVR